VDFTDLSSMNLMIGQKISQADFQKNYEFLIFGDHISPNSGGGCFLKVSVQANSS
jgi:hypothetical protein